jgi:hypothetical protein
MKSLVELIVGQEMPFSFVEYSGLNVFLKGLNPLFKLCSRQTMQRSMMKSYTSAKEVIQRLILKSGNSMFSATTDLWTAGNQNVGYICVTLHWINADFELIHLLIAFEEMPQPHSGINLAVVLYRIFNSWNIEPHMLLPIVMDNASNNSTCCEELFRIVELEGKSYFGGDEYLQGHCSAHILNLIANDALKSLDIATLKVRQCILAYKSSPKQKSILEGIISCNFPLLLNAARPALDCKTRWNSVVDMLQTSLPYAGVFETWYERGGACSQINNSEWMKVKILCDLLLPLKDSTVLLSSSNTPYISSHLY